MNTCDCIKQLDTSKGITQTEINRFACLKNTAHWTPQSDKDPLKDQLDVVPSTQLIAILFKAVQELKADLDALKATSNSV